MRDLVDQRRSDLNGSRAGTDHAHPLAFQRHAASPPRGVDAGAGKTIEARAVGKLRMVQHAGRGNDDVSDVFAAAGSLEVPTAVTKGALRNLFVKSHFVRHAVVARHVLEILIDFRCWVRFRG